MEEVLEYELLNIEWDLNYEFDQETPVRMVCDDSGEQSSEKEDKLQIVYDENGIPKGTSYEDERIRKELIYSFIKKWKEEHEDPTIFNIDLSEFVKINQVFLIEATAHASKSYLSTKAVFQFEEVIRNAVKIGISKPKPDNKNQKPFQDMLIMKYHAEDLGTVKLTIGVRFKSHEKVQYGISVPPAGQPLIDPSLSRKNEGKKKAPHKK